MDSAKWLGLNALQIRRLAAIGQFVAASVILVDLLGINRFRAAGRLLMKGNRRVRLVRLRLNLFAQATLGMIALLPNAIPGNPPASLIVELDEKRQATLRKSLRRFRRHPWIRWIYLGALATPVVWCLLRRHFTNDFAGSWFAFWFFLLFLAVFLAVIIVPIGLWLVGIVIGLPVMLLQKINEWLVAWLENRKLRWSLMLISFLILCVSSLLGVIFA